MCWRLQECKYNSISFWWSNIKYQHQALLSYRGLCSSYSWHGLKSNRTDLWRKMALRQTNAGITPPPPPTCGETLTWPVGTCPEEVLLVSFSISFLATYSSHCENSKLLCQMLQHWKVVYFHFSMQLVTLFRTKLIRHKWFSINLILPILFQVIFFKCLYIGLFWCS